LSLLPLVAGCTNLPTVHGIAVGSAAPFPASAYRAEPARREGGSIVIGDWESPTNFSPLFNDEVPAAEIDSLLYAGLTRRDADLRPIPDLVARVPTLENGDVTWDRTSQRMDVTYELRPGLRVPVLLTLRDFRDVAILTVFHFCCQALIPGLYARWILTRRSTR